MNNEKSIQQNCQDEHALRVAYLIAGFIKDILTEKEHDELDDWVSASLDNERFFGECIDKRNRDNWLKSVKHMKNFKSTQQNGKT